MTRQQVIHDHKGFAPFHHHRTFDNVTVLFTVNLEALGPIRALYHLQKPWWGMRGERTSSKKDSCPSWCGYVGPSLHTFVYHPLYDRPTTKKGPLLVLVPGTTWGGLNIGPLVLWHCCIDPQQYQVGPRASMYRALHDVTTYQMHRPQPTNVCWA